MKIDPEAGSLEATLLDKAPRHKHSIISGVAPKKSILNRRNSQKKMQLRDLNSHKVVFISTMFAMVFSPFNGVQNFLHEMMKEFGYANLGLLALAIFYISFGLGSFITPQYSTNCEYKYVFLISFLPMSTFFFSLWLSLFCIDQEEYSFCSSGTIYLIVFASSILAGLGTSLLWISKSIYITDCSNPFNKGKMFGIFSSIAPWTYLIGPVFSGLVLHDFGAKNLFKLIAFLCVLTSLMALGVKKPEKDSGDAQLLIELTGLAGNEQNATDGGDGMAQNSGVVIPRMEYFNKEFFWKCLTTQKMLIFYPLFLSSACNFSIFIAYLSSDVFGILKEGNTSIEAHFSHEVGAIAWVFLAFGLGEILADRFFSAKVQTDKKAALSLVYKVFLACAVLHLIQHVWRWYPLYILLAFLYGVGDAGSQDVIGGLISMKFFERFEPFTCFRIIYFVSLGGFFLIHLLFVEAAPVVSFVLFIFLIIFAWLNNYKFFTTLS